MRRAIWILGGVLGLAAAAVLVWFVVVEGGPPQRPPDELADALSKASTPTPSEDLAVQLYFVAPDGMKLTVQEAEITPTGDPASEAAATLQRLFDGPSEDGGLLPSVPEGVRLRGLYLDGKGTAFVDLGGVAGPGLGGTHDEMLLAYAITDTLAYTFPVEIRRVRLLLDGQETATLGGHLAIAAPLLPRRDLVAVEEE